jgi:hypothetical protein
MTIVRLSLPEQVYAGLMNHLAPISRTTEELAFVFVGSDTQDGHTQLDHVDWFPVPPSGFVHRSGLHLELTDEMRATIIKKAHDLNACLVEFHSHRFSAAAAFSPSDLEGLDEFVPHVRWRLNGRPYLAVVVGPASFDALAWVDGSGRPGPLDHVRVGDRIFRPTGITLRRLETHYA